MYSASGVSETIHACQPTLAIASRARPGNDEPDPRGWLLRERRCFPQRVGTRAVSDTFDVWYDRAQGIDGRRQPVRIRLSTRRDATLARCDTLRRFFSTTLARTNPDANALSRDGDLHVIGADEHPL